MIFLMYCRNPAYVSKSRWHSYTQATDPVDTITTIGVRILFVSSRWS